MDFFLFYCMYIGLYLCGLVTGVGSDFDEYSEQLGCDCVKFLAFESCSQLWTNVCPFLCMCKYSPAQTLYRNATTVLPQYSDVIMTGPQTNSIQNYYNCCKAQKKKLCF